MCPSTKEVVVAHPRIGVRLRAAPAPPPDAPQHQQQQQQHHQQHHHQQHQQQSRESGASAAAVSNDATGGWLSCRPGSRDLLFCPSNAAAPPAGKLSLASRILPAAYVGPVEGDDNKLRGSLDVDGLVDCVLAGQHAGIIASSVGAFSFAERTTIFESVIRLLHERAVQHDGRIDVAIGFFGLTETKIINLITDRNISRESFLEHPLSKHLSPASSIEESLNYLNQGCSIAFVLTIQLTFSRLGGLVSTLMLADLGTPSFLSPSIGNSSASLSKSIGMLKSLISNVNNPSFNGRIKTNDDVLTYLFSHFVLGQGLPVFIVNINNTDSALLREVDGVIDFLGIIGAMQIKLEPVAADTERLALRNQLNEQLSVTSALRTELSDTHRIIEEQASQLLAQENQIASLMAKLEVELNAIQQAKEQTIAKKDQELAAVKARVGTLQDELSASSRSSLEASLLCANIEVSLAQAKEENVSLRASSLKLERQQTVTLDQLATACDKNRTLTSANESLSLELRNLQNAFASMKNEVRVLQIETARLNDDLRRSKEESAKHEATIEEKTQTEASLRSEMSSLSKKLAEYEERLADEISSKEELERSSIELKQSLREADDIMTGSQRDFHAAQQQQEKELKSLQSQLKEMNVAAKNKTAELEELKKKLQKTEEATSTLKSKSDELQEACLKIKELEEVESALKTRTSELEKVKKKLHESKEHQSRLAEELKEKTADLDAAKRRLRDKFDANSRVKELESELEQKSALEKDLSLIKKQLREKEKSVARTEEVSAELQEWKQKAKSLEAALKALRASEAAGMGSDSASAKQSQIEINALRQQLKDYEADKLRLKELELDVESHSKKIQQEVERATRKARKEQEDKMDDMERKLADLQDVEQNGRKELDRLQRALQSQKRALAESEKSVELERESWEVERKGLQSRVASLEGRLATISSTLRTNHVASAAEEPEKGGVPPRVLRATQPAKPPMKPKERPERRKPPIVQKKDQDQDDEVIPDSTKIPDTQADDQPATTSNEEAPSEVEESEPMAVRPADEDDIDDDSDENTKRERVRGRAELKGSSKPAKTEAKGSKRQAAPRKKKEDGKAGKKLKPTPPPEEAAANASLQAAASTSAAAAAASKPQFSFSSALLAAAPPFLGNATTSNPFLLATAPNLDAVSSFGSTLRAGKKRLNALMAGKEDQ